MTREGENQNCTSTTQVRDLGCCPLPELIWRQVQSNTCDQTDKNACWEFFKFSFDAQLLLFHSHISSHWAFSFENATEETLLFLSCGPELHLTFEQHKYILQDQGCLLKKHERKVKTLHFSASPNSKIMILRLPNEVFSDVPNENSLDSIAPQRLYECLTAMTQTQENMQFRKQYLFGKTCEIISELLSQFAQRQETNQNIIKIENFDITQKAESILHRLYASPPSLEQLARRIGTNRNKLSKSFKVVHGLTVFEYCQQYRMKIAQKMLSEHDYSVAHVAEKVGYDHPGNFTSAYKRHFGELPKSTRQHQSCIKKIVP